MFQPTLPLGIPSGIIDVVNIIISPKKTNIIHLRVVRLQPIQTHEFDG
jgi:hypothetical protein